MKGAVTLSTLDSKTVTSGDEAGISRELLLKMWENMNLARNFEEHVQWLFSKGLVHGTTHLGIGEEATAAGTIAALKPQDYVFGTHRGHSQAICKGISVNNMMAEILARETGVCKGKGGSMHIADMEKMNHLGARISTTSAPTAFWVPAPSCATALHWPSRSGAKRIVSL